VYYQRLQIPINELENKKQFKCLWISHNLRDEKELVLYPNRWQTRTHHGEIGVLGTCSHPLRSSG
jgi:hypothetical protein